MNKIHRVLWSRRTSTFVVAAEITKSCSGASSSVARRSLSERLLVGAPWRLNPLKAALLAAGLIAPIWPSVLHAQTVAPTQLPVGGQLSAGQASIAKSGSVMSINQSSSRAALNWQSFDVGSQARVNIQQPSASSVLLNRIQGDRPSQIFGQINANGQVILTNPAGVYF
ncbi:MAG: filamentous hemagglutinin N-terminal domain-containing protein [Burkholderiaceae bacterium]